MKHLRDESHVAFESVHAALDPVDLLLEFRRNHISSVFKRVALCLSYSTEGVSHINEVLRQGLTIFLKQRLDFFNSLCSHPT